MFFYYLLLFVKFDKKLQVFILIFCFLNTKFDFLMLAVAANFSILPHSSTPISRPKHRTHGPLAATDPVGSLFVYVSHNRRPHFTYTTCEHDQLRLRIRISIRICIRFTYTSLLLPFTLPFVLAYCILAVGANRTLYTYTFCVGETEVSCKLS